MPELPEVETIAREIRAVEGLTIRDVVVERDDYVRASPPSPLAHLHGKRVGRVGRQGKTLFLELLPHGRATFHLGMSGRLTWSSRDLPLEPHTHFRLGFSGSDREIRMQDPRRFGGIWIRSDAGEPLPDEPAELGPDALSIRWSGFRKLLSRKRQIKALLLDQHAIAGLGNIYVDEILYASRVHPLTRASELAEDAGREVLRHTRRILRSAIRSGGSTFRDYRRANGARGAYQRRHRAYGREGLPCGRCGTAIVREAYAGRSSHFCPRCQRA